jgi:tetratricopeptide (TPR) repeat protein
MGLFDFLKRSRQPAEPAPGPDQLLDLLTGAAVAGQAPQVERLCRQHREAILQHFPAWQKVPEGIRKDQQALQRHVHTLITVAQCFAGPLGEPALLERLTGPPGSNPLERWQEKLQQARRLMNELHYDEAVQLLGDLLIDVCELRGSGADHYLPVTFGHLGEAHFQQGQADKALPHLEQALRLCQQSGDQDGVAAYLGNLYEVHRYAGRAGPAADCAEQLAGVLAQRKRSTEAARYRRQAAIVRAGEPLNRVVAVVDGRTLELDELTGSKDLHVQFVFQRNRPSLRPAEVLIQRGGELGSQGAYDEALEAFQAAARADPYEPHAHYEAGAALLHLRRYAEAIESFEATEERAPGWFHCRSDLWLSRQLLDGAIPHEVYYTLRVLQDGNLPPQERARLAGQACAGAPAVAAPAIPLLHLLYGKVLEALKRPAEAEAAYRQGLAAADEPDVRSRLLLALGVLPGPPAERSALLREARDLKGNLVAAASAHIALLCRGEGN